MDEELEHRIIATGIVERLRARGEKPLQIRVWRNGSGMTTRVAFEHSLAVEAIIPPGFYSFDRIVDDLCGQLGRAVVDSDS